ncbi:putative nucleotidyltransferase with HDIG domain [Parabacteroides sp. PF5-5]|uniref:HD family phosphohydrolase n=1 Tax=unclassified Parabacteroides TaxID=2649774 RepID=UPI002476427F|nr:MULTISPECIES: HDIG domain-containing metalloprotein [unclassified Parabacteroides]MDH6305384.1 putative nucleotidyltransferase with HDIG domain [Parabacteroides sp. PH5-39]MDH6316094.1 putative nucleotidyltransferase with HDIG domain [Parabacteroides sp. PF5-13]MDH6320244.1 putative nucleotidyltransferase with HDIG domain [Parabacteroides sp. PH5-13]MDH6323974.1 putative nucleotidyltransferase with HDIG domain [Parabacteroides sp. PH5-8]MDH6327285.1 putative nucleotidyltransferase with HDIG
MKLRYYTIPTAVLFILTAIVIGYFFPREVKFRYQFYEGKPWRYELLTAPSDFPIYKTEAEIKAERDSVLSNFEPYFRTNKTIETEEVEKLRTSYASLNNEQVTPAYMQYIEKSIVQLYKIGIVAYQELEDLKKDGYKGINLLENNIVESRYVSDLFTVRTAYEFILNNAPASLDKDILRTCNINNYLVENISFDQDMTDKVREDRLQSLSISNGMVQAGERIVDRGEIVDNHTYNILRSLKIVHESKTGGKQRQGFIFGGQFVLVFGIILCFWLYLWSFRPRILYSRKNTSFMLLCLLVSCLLTEICVSHNLFNVYILPYAIVPIVVRTFFDSRTALFIHLVITLICSLMVPYPHEFLLLQIVAGMVVTFSLRDLSDRSQLIRCAFFLYLSYTLSYLSMSVYLEGDPSKLNWLMLLYFGINFILLMFTYVLIYMLEKAFGYISTITLVELSNINTPLLKKLSEVAPGTFQHSLQVSSLASDAASKIGANAQLVRTGAMYHDIGKTTNPAFFTENQKNVNPHDQLTFEQSAQIIIGHVTEGVKLAEKASIPQAIIDFIRTHHGKGKAKYFYNMYKNKFPDKEIDEETFTYPGPNPFSKETGVLMMADSVEAASRSLTDITEENIKTLVNKIVDGQLADGLLKNTPLTFRDIEIVKNTFIEKLKIMYHTRISYPELKK